MGVDVSIWKNRLVWDVIECCCIYLKVVVVVVHVDSMDKWYLASNSRELSVWIGVRITWYTFPWFPHIHVMHIDAMWIMDYYMEKKHLAMTFIRLA